MALVQLMEGQEQSKEVLETLVNKIDSYETIELFNGPNNDRPLTRPRKLFLQEMYVGNKKIDALTKDFTDHQKKTFGKEAGKLAVSAAMDLTGFGIVAKAVTKGVSFGVVDSAEEIIENIKSK